MENEEHEENREKFSLSEVAEWIPENNIADDRFDEATLLKLGNQVNEDYKAAKGSMTDWIELYEMGQNLSKPATEPRSNGRWNTASNYKSPILQDSSYAFGERASAELLRPKDLVKAEVIGQDPTDEKALRAKRVSMYQSYQVNHEMGTWRTDERELLYRLPSMGTLFKKTFFDPLEERLVSEIIEYPNFVIDQATGTNFTHVLPMTKNEVISLQRADIWRECDLGLDQGDMNLLEDDTDKYEGNKESHSPLYAFLEQQCFFDLDGDGYEEPYTVTIHHGTGKVVRILPRFNLKGIILTDSQDRRYQAKDVYGEIEDEYGPLDGSGEPELGFGKLDDQGVLMKTSMKYEIIRINPLKNLTARRFLPSTDGTYLGVGYYQLMAPLVESLNTNVNQLTDAATLANIPGGYIARGVRKKRGDDQIGPGEYKDTELPPDQLKNAILPLPTKEPSQALFQMVERTEASLKEMSANIDISSILEPNTAGVTALTVMDEAQSRRSSLMSEQARGLSNEFQIMYELNAIYIDPEHYKMIVEDPEADYKQDFNKEDLNIFPTANPEMANKTQRTMQAQMKIDNLPLIIENGGNGHEIVKRWLVEMGEDNIDAVIPAETKDFMTAKTNNENAQAEQANAQTGLLTEQTNMLAAQGNALNAKAARDRAELRKLPAELQKMKAEMTLIYEKAETEETKNMIDLYMIPLNEAMQSLDNIGKIDDIELNRAAAMAAGGNPGQTGQAPANPNPARGLSSVA